MKNFLLICCMSVTVLAPAKAQVSRNDFEKQVNLFKVAGQSSFGEGQQIDTWNKLIDMMNQQIDYVNKKFSDKELNAMCNVEKRQQAKVMGACNQLQAFYNTLTTEKSSRDAVTSVAKNNVRNKSDFLLQQFDTFKNTLQ